MLWDVRQFKSKIDTESADSVLEVCLRENRQLIERMIGDDGIFKKRTDFAGALNRKETGGQQPIQLMHPVSFRFRYLLWRI